MLNASVNGLFIIICWLPAILILAGSASAQSQTGAGQSPLSEAEIQVLRKCYSTNQGNSRAIGNCVGVGIARSWTDRAVGSGTRKCAENPKACAAGRLLTYPKKQLSIWQARYSQKFKQREQELNSLLHRIGNPKKEIGVQSARVKAQLQQAERDVKNLDNSIK